MTLRHPNIVHVRNCFLANNTAYLAMNLHNQIKPRALHKKRRRAA